MPGATTPDNIVFPVEGDAIDPLNGWFAQQAASTQAALTALRGDFEEPELPAPISSMGNAVQAITATAWADIPNMSAVTLDLPRPCWVTLSFGAWITATAGDTRAGVRVTGATSISENQLDAGGPSTAWGQVLYTTPTGTRQGNSVRTVRLNAGTNTISGRAYRNGSGTNQVNYSSLQVAPLRWA